MLVLRRGTKNQQSTPPNNEIVTTYHHWPSSLCVIDGDTCLRLPSIIITPKPQDTEVMIRERGLSWCFEFFTDVPIGHSYPNVHISDMFTGNIYLCKGKYTLHGWYGWYGFMTKRTTTESDDDDLGDPRHADLAGRSQPFLKMWWDIEKDGT